MKYVYVIWIYDTIESKKIELVSPIVTFNAKNQTDARKTWRKWLLYIYRKLRVDPMVRGKRHKDVKARFPKIELARCYRNKSPVKFAEYINCVVNI